MTLIADTVAEFGRSIGMPDLVFREDGGLVLGMEKLGTLAFELVGPRREDVAVSLSRSIETPDAGACAHVLELCHYRNPAPYPVRAGLARQGELFFAIGMEAGQFTLPGIHQALEWLIGLHDQSSTSVRYT